MAVATVTSLATMGTNSCFSTTMYLNFATITLEK